MMSAYFKNILFCLCFLGVLGCGNDNATGPDPGEPPTIPSLEMAEPDISFFQENQQQGKSNAGDAHSFSTARQTVIGGAFQIMIGSFYGSFLNQASTEDAEFNDGVWEWSYSSSFEGMYAEYKTTAEELSNGSVRWAVYWTIDDGERSFEDYKMMEGTVTEDGSEGDWTFNSLNSETNQETPAIISKWKVDSDTEKKLSIELFSGDDGKTEIDYEQDGSVYTMIFSSSSQQNDVTVIWNTETGAGSINQEGVKSCWDSNFQDVACS